MSQDHIKPMLAETADKPFNSPDYSFQLKIDGVRAIAYLDNETRILGRSDREITRQFPELKDLHKIVRKPCVLDGELVCFRGSFADIQSRIHKERDFDILIASKRLPAIYYVFDLPLVIEHLYIREQMLNDIVPISVCCCPLPSFPDGIELFEMAKKAGKEGIMAKRKASYYQQGRRSRDWLKIKNFQEGIFQIYGLTRGENSRNSSFGSLILGKDGKFVGCVGTGFDEATLRRLLERLSPLRANKTELIGLELDKELLFFTEPKLSCEVRFLEYGSDRHLRFPSYRGLRG